MKILKWALAALTLSLVAACGGDGENAGKSPFGSAVPGCPAASAASGAAGCATASNLVLQLSAPTVRNDGSSTITATATATTSGGQAVSGIPVTFSVDANANFTTTGTATGSTGQLAAVVSIGSDPSNRPVTVTAKSGSLTATATFAVTGSKLAATANATTLAPGQAGQVEFRLTNANDVALPNQAIVVSAGAAGTATGTTDINGAYTFAYTAPTTLGTLNITANAGGVEKIQAISVQTSGTTPLPAVGPILSASVSANPSVVPTNAAGSSVNRTEIRALFVGASNAPIERVRVRFDLNGDPASIGGTFSTGASAVLYSDVNGIATTAYIPAERASPTNGLTIRACYSTADFAPGTCPNQTLVTITVISDPLSVTIGSNAIITPGPDNLTYQRHFVVLVVDASGRAKGNVEVVPSIDLLYYFKGRYVRGTSWFPGVYDANNNPIPRNQYGCPNEDLNRNAVNETGPVNEDVNFNGSLEPRKSDAAVSMVGGSKTKDDGTAVVRIEYPQNVATWLQVKLLVSATGISGTEGRATWTEILPPPVDAINGTGDPPFVFSPYGLAIDNASVDYPGPPPTTNPNATPCQNPD